MGVSGKFCAAASLAIRDSKEVSDVDHNYSPVPYAPQATRQKASMQDEKRAALWLVEGMDVTMMRGCGLMDDEHGTWTWRLAGGSAYVHMQKQT